MSKYTQVKAFKVKAIRTASALSLGLFVGIVFAQGAPQITFYENNDFIGRSFTTTQPVTNFGRQGFNDRASSVVVSGGRWEVCEDASYGGRCVVLKPGNYSSLGDMALNDRLSSTRLASGRRGNQLDAPEPMAGPAYDYRRRPNERLYQADVTYARAVVGTPEQRCWVEPQQVTTPAERSGPSVGRGILGAVIGGVIGHQIGNGTGRDIATVGGAVTGAVLGAKSGQSSGTPQVTTSEVKRCENVANQPAAYWDVGYTFKGIAHQVQLKEAPGATVQVNKNGEPRQ